MIIYNEKRHNIFIPSGLGGSTGDCDYRYHEGYTEGYDDGYDEGYEDGFEAGIAEKNTMFFMAEEEGCAVSMNHYGDNQPEGLQYSFNGYIWNDWNGEEVPLDMGEKMYVRCTRISHDTYIYSTFSFAGRVGAYGSVKSLNGYKNIPSHSAFKSLFQNSTLTKAPIIDYEYATYYCFEEMFKDCVNLTEAPELPITNAGAKEKGLYTPGIFRNMFTGCVNLTKAPSSINLEIIGHQQCLGIFDRCINLEKAPIIYSKTIDEGCQNMFARCEKLNEVEIYADNIINSGINSWLYVYGSSTTGVVINHGTYEYEKDSYSGIPNGWIECINAYNEGGLCALNTGVAFENESSRYSMPYLIQDNNRLTYVMRKDATRVNYMASDDAYNTILNGYYCPLKATGVSIKANRVAGVQFRVIVVYTPPSGRAYRDTSMWYNSPTTVDIQYSQTFPKAEDYQVLVEFRMADGSDMTRDIAERLNTQVSYTVGD